MSNSTPIEVRIEEELHHLLDFMKAETGYSDEYKSMVGHFTKVMELRQKGSDSKSANAIKLQELEQQLAISETNNAIKLQELEQQKNLSDENITLKIQELQQQKFLAERAHALKEAELQQQKDLSEVANAIKQDELDLKKTITKEAWLTVGTHIGGLIVLMNHERAHVIASKAFGLLKKII